MRLTKRVPKPRRRRRLTNIAILPTLITLGNLICGTIAIFKVAKGFALSTEAQNQALASDFYASAGLFILLAMVFDALDGYVARLSKSESKFGAQLDSLSDLVSFGVAPGFLVLALCTIGPFAFLPDRLIYVVCVFYVVCAAVRLARFNIETDLDVKSHLDFSGLPSPASAGVIAASVLPWSAFHDFAFLEAISNVMLHGLPFVAFLLSVLMISRIRYPHVVNKLFRGNRPFVVFVELALSVVLVVLFHEFAIFLVFAVYAVSGPAVWVRLRFQKKETPKVVTRSAQQEESLF